MQVICTNKKPCRRDSCFVSVHPMQVPAVDYGLLSSWSLRVPCRCEIPCVLMSKPIWSTCVDNEPTMMFREYGIINLPMYIIEAWVTAACLKIKLQDIIGQYHTDKHR